MSFEDLFVLFGAILILLAVVFFFRGEISGRGQVVTRDEKPIAFAFILLAFVVGGLVLIAIGKTTPPHRGHVQTQHDPSR